MPSSEAWPNRSISAWGSAYVPVASTNPVTLLAAVHFAMEHLETAQLKQSQMIETLRTGHPLSAFENIVVDGKQISRARPPQGHRWEMERALHILEELLDTEATARRKGLAVMIDWWAPQ